MLEQTTLRLIQGFSSSVGHSVLEPTYIPQSGHHLLAQASRTHYLPPKISREQLAYTKVLIIVPQPLQVTQHDRTWGPVTGVRSPAS